MVSCLRVLILHDKFWWKSQTSLTALKSPMSSMVDSQRKPSLTNNCMLITTYLVGGWQQLFGELGFLSESTIEDIGDRRRKPSSESSQSSKPQSQTSWLHLQQTSSRSHQGGGLVQIGSGNSTIPKGSLALQTITVNPQLGKLWLTYNCLSS